MSDSDDGFSVRFWGVRGSIAAPGPSTVAVGGNTSCVEVCVAGERVIFDAGTGVRALGETLQHRGPVRASLFLSHVHWDHIQGLPFFAPLYEEDALLRTYAGRETGRTLRGALAGQMAFPYFPVRFDDVTASVTCTDLAPRDRVEVGARGVTVHGVSGHHPDGAFIYRLEHKGHAVVYATDLESSPEVDARVIEIARGADVLILDAQYTPEEYAGDGGKRAKVGWGHSTMLDAARLAREAGVGTLALFHHDPGQSDAAVADKERRAREVFERTVAAREGAVIDVTRAKKRAP